MFGSHTTGVLQTATKRCNWRAMALLMLPPAAQLLESDGSAHVATSGSARHHVAALPSVTAQSSLTPLAPFPSSVEVDAAPRMNVMMRGQVCKSKLRLPLPY